MASSSRSISPMEYLFQILSPAAEPVMAAPLAESKVRVATGPWQPAPPSGPGPRRRSGTRVCCKFQVTALSSSCLPWPVSAYMAPWRPTDVTVSCSESTASPLAPLLVPETVRRGVDGPGGEPDARLQGPIRHPEKRLAAGTLSPSPARPPAVDFCDFGEPGAGDLRGASGRRWWLPQAPLGLVHAGQEAASGSRPSATPASSHCIGLSIYDSCCKFTTAIEG
jgi:hypothetical protein